MNINEFLKLTGKEKSNLFLNIFNKHHDGSANEIETSQQEKIGEEENSLDLDINLMLDNSDRIKNLPRSKINSVRIDKFILNSQSCSPSNGLIIKYIKLT